MPVHAVPRYLGAPSRAWLRHLTESYDFTPTEWRLLTLAAEAFDRAQTARRTLHREGLTLTVPVLSKKGEKVGERITAHPAAAIARDATALYSRLVAQIGLDDEGEARAAGRAAAARGRRGTIRRRTTRRP
jgi:P27 family predicted phage terminase small subunit